MLYIGVQGLQEVWFYDFHFQLQVDDHLYAGLPLLLKILVPKYYNTYTHGTGRGVWVRITNLHLHWFAHLRIELETTYAAFNYNIIGERE